jgi:hypothetical protein
MESAHSELPLFELVVGADKVSVFTRFVRLVLFLLGRSIPYSDARYLTRTLVASHDTSHTKGKVRLTAALTLLFH